MRFRSNPVRVACLKFWLICALLVLVSCSMPAPASAQITFNTALPVTEGEGILRVQSKYIRSTDDPGPMDRELNVWAFPIVGVYGVTEKLALFSIVPVLDKTLEVNTPMGRRTRNVTGLGDITFLARYTAYQRDRAGETFRVAPFVGIEVPTGDDDKKDSLGSLPQPLQLGSGSWDPLIGAATTWQTLDWEVDAAVSYKFNAEANNFQFGDEGRFDIGYKRRLWPRELGPGVPSFLYAALESNLIWQDENRVGGADDRDSGGITWFLAPGIQYVTKRFVLEAAVQLPVVQNLGGNALENDFITTLSFRVNF